MSLVKQLSTGRLINNQKGVSAVLVAILLPVLLGFGALAIDVGYMYATKNELQNVSDAAALAGAAELGQLYLELTENGIPIQNYVLTSDDITQIKTAAMEVAELNDAAGTSIALSLSDIYIGFWDFMKEHDPNHDPNDDHFKELADLSASDYANAVRVDSRRDSIMNLPVGTYFARIFSFFGGDHDTFDSFARATAALSGIIGMGEAGHVPPIAISSINPCGTRILFHPSPDSCAGWHTFQDDDDNPYSANASQLRRLMFDFIKGAGGDDWLDNDWLTSLEGSISPSPRFQEPIGVEVGDTLQFIGGTLASLFNDFHFTEWIDLNTPDLEFREPEKPGTKTVVNADGTSVETINEETYAAFFALFDYFKFRDDQDPEEVITIEERDNNGVVIYSESFPADETWKTYVPVYFERMADGCGNPNQTLKVKKFASVYITKIGADTKTDIQVYMECNIEVKPGRGSGFAGNVLGSIPNLVE